MSERFKVIKVLKEDKFCSIVQAYDKIRGKNAVISSYQLSLPNINLIRLVYASIQSSLFPLTYCDIQNQNSMGFIQNIDFHQFSKQITLDIVHFLSLFKFQLELHKINAQISQFQILDVGSQLFVYDIKEVYASTRLDLKPVFKFGIKYGNQDVQRLIFQLQSSNNIGFFVFDNYQQQTIDAQLNIIDKFTLKQSDNTFFKINNFLNGFPSSGKTIQQIQNQINQ